MRSVRCLALLAAGAVGQLAPQAPVQPAEPAAGGLVLRFEVTLVQVDAVVTDSRGNHVPDLTAENFEVFQDGKPQRISHFSYVPGGSEPLQAEAAGGRPGLGPLTAEQVRRTMLFYIDDLRMDAVEFLACKAALKRFLDSDVQPGDLIAVFRSAYQSGFWQRFTTDLQHLRLTVDRMQNIVRFGGPGIQYLGSGYSLHTALMDLAKIPGRKALIHFGHIAGPGSVSRLSLFGITIGLPGAMTQDEVAINATADLANRSSVTIYTIDSRGLMVLDPHPGTWSRYIQSQGGSWFLARQTGGIFFSDYNDLGKLLSKAATDFGRGYYLLGWYPGEDAFKRKKGKLEYRDLKIRVRRKGLAVRTRAGYIGTVEKPAPRPPTVASAPLYDAIWSPFHSGDLEVDLTTRWGRDERVGPYVEAAVHVAPAGLDLWDEPDGCRTARLEFLFVSVPMTAPRTSAGAPQRPDASRYFSAVTVCREAMEQFARRGLIWRVRQKLERPGPYDLRVAVRNGPASGVPSITSAIPVKVGSASQFLEIPNVREDRLSVVSLVLGETTAREAADEQVQGIAVRVAADRDPGVRRFRAGEAVEYNWRVLYAPGRDALPVDTHMAVLRDGEEVYSGPLERLNFEKNEARVAGVYCVNALEPGRYWLAAVATERASDGKAKRTAREWLHFDVVK